MSVRAKFRVSTIECQPYTRQKPGVKGYGPEDVEKVEMRTIKLVPVNATDDQDHENTRFWNASPSGEVRLGTINPEAWAYFDLDGEYYIEFTKAD